MKDYLSAQAWTKDPGGEILTRQYVPEWLETLIFVTLPINFHDMIFLYILLILIAVILLAAAIMPKTLTISAEVVIEKPSTEVFNFVKLIKNQEAV